MTNLMELQTKVEMMLNGERKRRETALKLLNKIQEILEPVATDIWGNGEYEEFINAVWVRNKNKDEQNKATNIYFRYEEYRTERKTEYPGFYYSMEYPIWGTEIEEMKGADFWNSIRIVINWIPILVEMIDKRNESREALLKMVNLEVK